MAEWFERYAMRCSSCGAQLEERAQFCPHCGEPVIGADDAKNQDAARDGEPARPSVAKRSGEKADEPRFFAARSQASGRRASGRTRDASKQVNRSRHKFIAAVLSVAVLLVAFYLVWDVHLRSYGLNAKDFPSAGVRAAAASADTNGDGSISRDEAAAVKSLTITEGGEIYGFEPFPNLAELILDSDGITSVDVTSAPRLQTLSATNAAGLSSVVVGGNESLSRIDLQHTALSSIDLSGAAHLEALALADCPLKSIDVSHLTNLVALNLSRTDIKTVNVAGLTNLSSLSCDGDVTVENISDTSMQTYWTVLEFQNNVPAFGPLPRQRVQMKATYDERNRLESVTYEDAGSFVATPMTVEYSYDDAGRLVEARFANVSDSASALAECVWTLEYDDAGRLVGAKNDAGCKCTYAYDAEARPTSFVMYAPTGAIERYEFAYDKAGHLVSMVNNATQETVYAYNDKGQLTAAAVFSSTGSSANTRSQGDSSSSSSSSSQDATADDQGSFFSNGLSGQHDSSSSSAGQSSSSGSAQGNALSPRTLAATAQQTETYAYEYDENGLCIRCEYASLKNPVGSYTEVYSYAADGSLLDAQRTTKSGDVSWNYLYHDIASAQYGYAPDGTLTSGSLTRASQSEGAHETYALRYQRTYATPEYAPNMSIWQTAYPLACLMDDGTSIVSAISNGQSQLTPWARLPHVYDMVFNRSTVLFGAAAG